MKVVHRASRPHSAFAVLGLIGLLSLACNGGGDGDIPGGSGGSAPTGGANAGGGTTPGVGGAPIIPDTTGGPKLRVLTEIEYRKALKYLLGDITTPLMLPADTSKSGYVSIGASQISINASSVRLYEAASRDAAAEVFADAARWQQLTGCQAQATLDPVCTTAFIQKLGKRAFRRDVEQLEVDQWLKIGQEAAQLGASAGKGLETITTGILQSPYFLYRVETRKLDSVSGRLKYDGPSMATRLALLLTGAPPSDELLTAGVMGQLDTAEGVRAAAIPLMNDPGAVDRMAEFFNEFSQAQLVMVVQKSTEMFPEFTPALQNSMLQATQLFIKNVVLAPGADVRSFFDSNQTFIDANLAPIYGVSPPASGFMQHTLGPETGRAGILGQAGVLAGHSLSDHNSPTRRGLFITMNFLCQSPPPPPDGVITELPSDPTLTTRQRMELHRTQPSCAACHALFDPPGLALEHFDSVGKYRATENGLAIDATGMLDGVAFDGAAQLGATLRQNARALSCMMSNFYRNANGVGEVKDTAQVEALSQTLAAKGYNWREFLTEFVVSDAFRSTPAAAVTAGNQ